MSRRWARDERGSATIEMVLLFPVVMGILWLALQGGIAYYGRTVALAAAESGARAAAVENGTSAACFQAANTMLGAAADALVDTSVSCNRSATAVTVTVTGEAMSVGPWTVPPVSMTAELPVERIT